MENFRRDIERFLRTGEGDFDALALEVFRHQFELNKPYQSYCQALDLTPASVLRWQDIPAVPIGAFKSAELATFPLGQAAAVFESSGTTTQAPSRHYMKTLSLYEAAVKASFLKHVLADLPGDKPSIPFLVLTPTPAEAPHSSLSWMMDVVKREWGAPGSQYFIRQGRLDELWLITMLTKTQANAEPVLLLGTTIAFLGFLEYAARVGKSFQLAEGSRLMDTGGMKSSKREITRRQFVDRVTAVLGISENDCFNEYGMCELSSQFYGRGASSFLQGPPWVRTLVIDPLTGQPTRPGQAGLLRHFDLANAYSVLAIQTEDVGVASPPAPLPEGEGGRRPGEGSGFVLQGRDPNAEVKGCSLAAESFVA